MPQAKFQINHYQKFKFAAIFSCAAVFVGGVYFFQPFSFTADTNATTETTQNGDYYIETTTTDLNLSINTTPAGTQETASHDVIVKTDDPAGFTLTVSVNNDTSNALNLGGSTSATEKFNATSGTYASPKALDDNTWGFADTLTKKNNDQWAAVPLLSSAQQIKQTSSATPSGDTTTVHYGINAKYDGKHSNGNYSNTITYSVVGNTPPVKDLDDITYMQDINDYPTVDFCGNSTAYSVGSKQYTLKDKRDNSSYTIRKLADGNCWMVNNLKLSADTLSANSHSTTLDSTDTDLPSGTTFVVPATSNTNWGGSSYAIAAKIANSNNATYGMYYNWWAAVASTNNPTTQYQSVDTSICPKGWDLPKGQGGSTASTNNDWYAMMVTGYGLHDQTSTGNPTSFTGTAYELPFSGRWSYSQTTPQYQGSNGYWWSSTVSGTGNAYDAVVVNNGAVYAGTNYPNKRYGFSVRCMLFPSA